MVHSDQPQQNGAAGSGGSSSSAAAGAARPPKKQKQEKVPQRGLGVAELERILRVQQRQADASPPAPAPADPSSWCQSSSRRAAAPPLPVTTAPTAISGAGNLPMEPPSNQINAGSNSYPLALWPEDERACGMKRPWAFPFEHRPMGSSVLHRIPVFERSEELPAIHVLDPNQFESRSANVIRMGVPSFAEPDKKISNEDISQMKDGGFLTLGSSAPPTAPAVSLNLKLKQPVVAIPPSMYRELPDLETWQQPNGSISENSSSAWRPFQRQFYQFFPTASSRQTDAKSDEQAKKTGDEIDLNLKL